MSPRHPRLLGTYRLDGQRHRIELISHRGAPLLIDRPDDGGPVGVIAELYPGEGERQATALLHGDGAYLRRAQAGERGLCPALGAHDDDAEAPVRRAA
ncbi:MAG: hypothetical protein MSC31_17010 [Solirubrobacteraceae bacterium MAG38_C4-C5]|nr:hypothetical protein [Candidatus Siliceabacter maunaloa]